MCLLRTDFQVQRQPLDASSNPPKTPETCVLSSRNFLSDGGLTYNLAEGGRYQKVSLKGSSLWGSEKGPWKRDLEGWVEGREGRGPRGRRKRWRSMGSPADLGHIQGTPEATPRHFHGPRGQRETGAGEGETANGGSSLIAAVQAHGFLSFPFFSREATVECLREL